MIFCSKCGRTQETGKYCQECGGQLVEHKPLRGTLDVALQPATEGISYERDWMNAHQQGNVDHWIRRLRVAVAIVVSERGEVSACGIRLYHDPELDPETWFTEGR